MGLMSKEGPIVQAVMLREDGSHAEITIDMTPKANQISQGTYAPVFSCILTPCQCCKGQLLLWVNIASMIL